MALKYFCDGCDKELNVHPIKDVTISIIQSAVEVGVGAVHLCDSCYQQLKRDANPKQWMRVAPDR